MSPMLLLLIISSYLVSLISFGVGYYLGRKSSTQDIHNAASIAASLISYSIKSLFNSLTVIKSPEEIEEILTAESAKSDNEVN